MISELIGRFWNNISGATASQRMQQEFNAKEAEKQRTFEAQEAQKQRDYEERLSNTAIQRQSADAKAAGINTSMLYANSSSSGASTPSGSSAKGSAASSGLSSPGAIGVAGILHGAANIARAFNNDRNNNNDVSFKQVANTAKVLSKLLK